MNWLFARWALVFVSLIWVLAGCRADGRGAPAGVIENYLAARVESDLDRMILLSCPAWEANARVEAASFQSMDARLDGVSCAASEVNDDRAVVACTGQIVTTYQGEAREWSVAEQTYLTVLDGGEWRMCGYGE